MYEQAALDVDAQHRHEPTLRVFERRFADIGVERGRHGIVADFAGPSFDGVQVVEGDAVDMAGSVVHPKKHGSAPAVGHGRQRVGEAVPVGSRDTAAGRADALQLQPGILAEPDAAKQVRVRHRVPRSALTVRS